MVVHAWSPSTQESEARGSQFKDSLGIYQDRIFKNRVEGTGRREGQDTTQACSVPCGELVVPSKVLNRASSTEKCFWLGSPWSSKPYDFPLWSPHHMATVKNSDLNKLFHCRLEVQRAREVSFECPQEWRVKLEQEPQTDARLSI